MIAPLKVAAPAASPSACRASQRLSFCSSTKAAVSYRGLLRSRKLTARATRRVTQAVATPSPNTANGLENCTTQNTATAAASTLLDTDLSVFVHNLKKSADLPARSDTSWGENEQPRKTHIVCTLGPASRTIEELSALLRNGMNVARFNMSHGDHAYHTESLENLNEAVRLTGLPCATLLDTKGPEIRTGNLKESGNGIHDGKLHLTLGKDIILTTDYTHEGDADMLAISYPDIAKDMKPGNKILMADGSVMLEVKETYPEEGKLLCTCLNNAEIGSRKNCNLPGVIVNLPVLTAKDESDIVDFGIKNGLDIVAASFVRKASDVQKIRSCLGDAGRHTKVISKIENQEGIENFDEILEYSDGIMVARGDLGMEIPLEKMFYAQKLMIYKSNIVGKPVITATQMLDSMIKNPKPTRAECTDVANAVLDGTDCVMLSGETAAGSFPVESVKTMSRICMEAERCVDNFSLWQSYVQTTLRNGPMSVIESLASSAVGTVYNTDAKCIVVLASTGSAARMIAKFRPAVPVVVGVVPRESRENIGFTSEVSSKQVIRQLQLTRGVIPVIVQPKVQGLDAPTAAKICVEETVQEAKLRGLVKTGELVVSMYNVERQCAVVRVVEVP